MWVKTIIIKINSILRNGASYLFTLTKQESYQKKIIAWYPAIPTDFFTHHTAYLQSLIINIV
jgi:hypothetical protein